MVLTSALVQRRQRVVVPLGRRRVTHSEQDVCDLARVLGVRVVEGRERRVADPIEILQGVPHRQRLFLFSRLDQAVRRIDEARREIDNVSSCKVESEGPEELGSEGV